jgi:hypothetical protein
MCPKDYKSILANALSQCAYPSLIGYADLRLANCTRTLSSENHQFRLTRVYTGKTTRLTHVPITPPYSLQLLPLRATLYTKNTATTTSNITPTTPANQSAPQLQSLLHYLHSLRRHHYTGCVTAVCCHYRAVNYGSTSSDAVEVNISPSAPSDRMGRHLAFSTQPTSSTHYSEYGASVQQREARSGKSRRLHVVRISRYCPLVWCIDERVYLTSPLTLVATTDCKQ